MLGNPLYKVFSRELTSGQSQHRPLAFINMGHKLKTIYHKKRFHRSMTDSFIAIDKRMVHDQRKASRGSLGFNRRVEFLTTERHLWLSDRRFDAAQIPHARCTARCFDNPGVKVENFS
jgi:hypothetical protein